MVNSVFQYRRPEERSLREELVDGLIAAGIPSPRLEADIILKYMAPSYPAVNEREKKAVLAALGCRLRHKPLDKIVGEKEFYKSVFKVNEQVLSPRPDTEILVEEALKLIEKNVKSRILDLGTGSGCVLLSLLRECPKAEGTGIDISSEALTVANENACRLCVEKRCRWINGSWNDIRFSAEKFDVIVSNPPYIPSLEIHTLAEEVKGYDPRVALDGGADGFCCYREIAAMVPEILQKGGYMLLESGAGQDREIIRIFEKTGLNWIKTAPDLAGINRCVILKK